MRRIGPELRPPRAVGAVAGESRDAAYIARGYRTLRRGPLSTSRDGPVPGSGEGGSLPTVSPGWQR